MTPLLIYCHLGLGDHLICNGLVRMLHKTNPRIFLPVKHHNLLSVAWMFKDLRLAYVPVSNDEEVEQYIPDHPGVVLRLGATGSCFQSRIFDQSFYEQGVVPFDCRWSMFKAEKPEHQALMGTISPYAFLHDDPKRGYVIDRKRVPFFKDHSQHCCFDVDNYSMYRPTPNLFSFWHAIENAAEIHCIDSSFAILADSIPTTAKRLFLHRYSRNPSEVPTYRKNWEILT